VDLFQDALKFVAAFSPVIARSAPHIYISAIPLAPKKSIIRNHFLPSFPRTLQFHGSVGERWSSAQKILQVHTSAVKSVVFSPDGKHIVSGAADETILVWDSETGAVVTGPLRGHTGSVNSVAFSPDGKQIVSGSDKLLVWDSVTGDILLGIPAGHSNPQQSPSDIITTGMFTGHSGSIGTVAFSSDGTLIASGSSDGMRIWDSKTGRQVS
jgi:WD40 repeat protein